MEPLGSFTNDSKINGHDGYLHTFFATRPQFIYVKEALSTPGPWLMLYENSSPS